VAKNGADVLVTKLVRGNMVESRGVIDNKQQRRANATFLVNDCVFTLKK